jgi:hydroxybutyrate-dimer hydrolase
MLALTACADQKPADPKSADSGAAAPTAGQARTAMTDFLVSAVVRTRHEGADDLLSAGLGIDGLRAVVAQPFANPDAPTAQELRRRAIWSNWRGIADLMPGGGYGDVYGAIPAVPGSEYQAFAKLPSATQPHRVLVQVPDAFDRGKRCLVVAVSSGSRGVYGAIALAGAWGLPRGCAVAYTDKGAGTGYYDADSATGVALDGTRAARGAGLDFEPAQGTAAPHTIAIKHVHSGDNPEADWGRHAVQAAKFALATLSEAFPNEPRFDFSNTRVIAAGLSNGGGAVLRAAEIDDAGFAGVVAIAPNIWPGADDAQPIYNYTTEAAIWQPCALAHPRFDAVLLARPGGKPSPAMLARCASLHERGFIKATDPAGQAQEAYDHLRASGWTDLALEAGALSTGFDLWRVVAAGYASAYGRYGADTMPCGYRYTAVTKEGAPRAATAAERAAWIADGSGIPPGAGVGLVDTLAAGADPTLPGLMCLRELWTADGEANRRIKDGIAATRARLPRKDLPVFVVHGADDGLIPSAFTGGAYSRWVEASGQKITHWEISNAQHFDAFLGLPPLAARYVPLLPYAYRALDAMWAHVADGTPLPASGAIATKPRGMGAVLTKDNLGAMP